MARIEVSLNATELPPKLPHFPSGLQQMTVETIGRKNQLIQRVMGFIGSLWAYSEGKMEARPGIEPRSAALQAAA